MQIHKQVGQKEKKECSFGGYQWETEKDFYALIVCLLLFANVFLYDKLKEYFQEKEVSKLIKHFFWRNPDFVLLSIFFFVLRCRIS